MDKSSSNTENFQVIEDCTHQHLAIISSCTSFSNLLKLWCFLSVKTQASIRDIFTVTKLIIQEERGFPPPKIYMLPCARSCHAQLFSISCNIHPVEFGSCHLFSLLLLLSSHNLPPLSHHMRKEDV